MPKVEISPEHLEKIARSIGRAAEDMTLGSVERHAVERLLLTDEAMVAAFINWHLKCEDSEGQ